MRIVAVIVIDDEVNHFRTAQTIIQSLRLCNVIQPTEYIKWSVVGNAMMFFSNGLVSSPSFLTEGALL